MTRIGARRSLSLVAAGLAWVTAGCRGDSAAISTVVNVGLRGAAGEVVIPTGTKIRLSGELVAYLQKAEAAGLVTLREVPQDYWGSFLNTTQNMGRPYDVTETPKLEAVAVNPNLGGEAGDRSSAYRLRVKVSEAEVDKIISNEDYKGPLATPGEKYRLVLGTFTNRPTPAAKVLGPDLTSQVDWTMKFRCVVQYSAIKKEWTLVALDVGSLVPEQWLTTNVK